VLEKFMLEVGATKLWELCLKVRRIRSGASRDRPRAVVWLVNFTTPHRHLVVDVPVTSAHANKSVHRIGARLPLLPDWMLSMANLMRTSALLGTPSVGLVHESMTTIPSIYRMGV
jgi:hypothetical protein